MNSYQIEKKSILTDHGSQNALRAALNHDLRRVDPIRKSRKIPPAAFPSCRTVLYSYALVGLVSRDERVVSTRRATFPKWNMSGGFPAWEKIWRY